MARTAIISPNPASRVWRGRFVRRSRSIRARPAKCLPPRVSSAADFLFRVFRSRRRGSMPVYTVHAPVANGADLAATDKFVFVRDGFHFWAAVASVIWLLWPRLWLVLIAWIVLMIAIQFGMSALGASRGTIFAVDLLIAILMGFEAASLRRWTLSRRRWRQLDIVVADDEETAERRFFDRWTARQRGLSNHQWAVDPGAPAQTRNT